MPSIKQLVEELKMLGVDPDDIRLPAAIYDRIIDDAEEPDDQDERNPEKDRD
jgi:hypothetical protein